MTKAWSIRRSNVAKTASLALASSARCPSVVCFGVRTHMGRWEMSWSSRMKIQRIPMAILHLEQQPARLRDGRALLLSLSYHTHKA